MKILGIDICRSHGVAWLLSERPDKPRQYFRERNRTDPVKLPYTVDGVRQLLDLAPDAIALEPTGLHYARLLAQAASDNGIEVLWIAHAAVKSTRKAHLLPNKNDQADALILAMYGQSHYGDSDYFLSLELDSPALALRELLLQCQHISRQRTRLQNRIRQSLAHECPEVMTIKGDRKGYTVPSIWIALAGGNPPRHKSKRLIENTCGSGVSMFTRALAAQIVANIEIEIELDKMIDAATRSPEFDRYHAVMDRFAFGLRTRAILLGFIYPLEQYLSVDGKPIIERVQGKNGKTTKRRRSLGAFKLSLGIGMVEDSSGNSEKWVPGGSELCRKALWLWCFTKIEVKRNRKTALLVELGELLDQLKDSGIPAQLARSRVCAKAVTLLFNQLTSAK